MRFEPRLEADSNRLVAATAVLFLQHPSGRTFYRDELLDQAGATDVAHMLAEWSMEQVFRTVEL